MPVGVGLIGSGVFAREAHLPNLRPLIKSGRVEVRAIWSRTAKSAEALASLYVADGLKGSSTPKVLFGDRGRADLLAIEEIDAVLIAVAIGQLSPVALEALRAGKHVLAEKPLASDAEEGYQALVEHAAMKEGRPLYCVAENFRCEAALLKAASIAKELGSPISLELAAHMTMTAGSKYAFGWRLDAANLGYIGGQLLDGGVHHVAAMRMVAGQGSDVTRVAAAARLCSEHLPVMDTASAVLVFENGVTGTYSISFAVSNHKWEMTVVCRNGRVTVTRAVKEGVAGYVLKTERSTAVDVEEEFLAFTGIGSEMEDFVSACEHRSPEYRISARAAYNDLATIQAIVDSSESGAFVSVRQPPPL